MDELNTESVEVILRRTLAYAAGLAESQIAPTTLIRDLGIDSVSLAASGVVLEAEFGVTVSADDVGRIFNSATIADAIVVAHEIIEVGRTKKP